MTTPAVSLLLPVLDEGDSIDECYRTLADQDYAGPLEIVIADGGSTDGTRERLAELAARDDRVVVVDNPQRRQSPGLNLAAARASGEILVRADGHTTYARDYVRRSVDALLTSDAVAVGGLLRPEGTTATGRAVAAAMTSPLAIGPAKFHHSDRRESADTVYLGAFRRADLLALGGFRSLPSGAAEDADLYARWRREGRSVLLDPAIVSTYRPRQTIAGFATQNLRYGAAKAELLWLSGQLPSWRPLAPLALVVGLAGGTVVSAVAGSLWPILIVKLPWAAVVATVAVTRGGSPAGVVRVAAAVAAMHLSYGVGMLGGLIRGPRRVRRFAVEAQPS